MAQTLTRNKFKNPFFDMSATSPLNLVSAALNVRFYDLNGTQPHFLPLSPSFPTLGLGQFDNIMYLKH